MEFKGKHLFLALETDFNLNKTEYLRYLILRAINKTGANIEGLKEKNFEPQGYSLVVLISERHASLHTFPEKKSIFIDYFTCGEIGVEGFRKLVLEELKPSKILEDNVIIRPNGGIE